MRIAFSALFLLLLTLTALAGDGCKRAPASGQPAFVFCHPSAGQLDDTSLSAAAAQVAFDVQTNNDDRTEMISAAFDRPEVSAAPQIRVSTARHDRASAWQPVLLRPPRSASLQA